MSYWLRQRSILVNLVIMVFVWLSTNLNWYMCNFMVNEYEKVYVSGVASYTTDIVVSILLTYFFKRFGVKNLLFSSFTFAAVGGALVLTYGLQHQNSSGFIVSLLVARFGITMAYNTAFVGHADLFPVLFATSSMGYCSSLARLFTAISPILAKMDQPLPMYIFTVSCLLTGILTLFLHTAGSNVATKATDSDSNDYIRVS